MRGFHDRCLPRLVCVLAAVPRAERHAAACALSMPLDAPLHCAVPVLARMRAAAACSNAFPKKACAAPVSCACNSCLDSSCCSSGCKSCAQSCRAR